MILQYVVRYVSMLIKKFHRSNKAVTNSPHRKKLPSKETSYSSLKNLTTCFHLYRSFGKVVFQWKLNGFQHKQHYLLPEK